MALNVSINPPGGRYVEFIRVDIEATDDGTSPISTGRFEILLTTDGSIPSDTNTETIRRVAPILRFPLDGPTTLKFFARTLSTPVVVTPIQVHFYDLLELTARNLIRAVPNSESNYTIKVENKDIVRNDLGFYDVVYGKDKTAQDVTEIILVETVSTGRFVGNRTMPNFGSELNTILGKPFPVTFAASRIQTSIFQALNTLIALQKKSRAPAHEQIAKIVSLSVVPQSKGEATSYRYHFVVETVNGGLSSGTGSVVGG